MGAAKRHSYINASAIIAHACVERNDVVVIIQRTLTASCAVRNMANMADRKYLDPAYSLIMSYSPSGKLSEGIDAVAAIVGRDRSNVYRWMIAPEKGGTGGFVPALAQRKLHENGRKPDLSMVQAA